MSLFSKKSRTQDASSDLAGQVQQLLLPKSPPVCDWSCIGVRNHMAESMGGDFFDFLPTADGCQAVMIGDVVGHGASAALVMGLVYGYLHSKLQTVCSIYQAVSGLNEFLQTFATRSQTHDHLFSATIFLGIIEPQSLKLDYINAGHPPPLIRRGGQVLALDPTTQPLGFFDVQESSVQTIQFRKHDRWLLYTDGITETANAKGKLFGRQRLDELLLGHQGDHLEFLDALLEEVMAFDGSGEPQDDCTAIAIDFHREQTQQ